MMNNQRTVQLVYIHGFRGDQTSFQAFPTDLQERVVPILPQNITLESYVYPTYKSVRPIAEATKHLLEWLHGQPEGQFILLAHSMGGLLAAEAATASTPVSRRIIGLVSFDVPFLGMHPHVVISGIVSLFPKDKGTELKTETEMNDTNQVKMTRPNAADDEWEVYKATIQAHNTSPPLLSPPLLLSPSPTSRPTSPAGKKSPSPSSKFFSKATDFVISKYVNKSSSPSLHESPSSSSLLSHASEFVLAKYGEEPVVKWLSKHSNDPLTSMKRWIVEHFEFGICMFEPAGLRDRYQALERWNGRWINYWTETAPCSVANDNSDNHANDVSALPSNTADIPLFDETPASSTASLSTNSTPGGHSPSESKALTTAADKKQVEDAEKALKKERELERKHQKPRPARHFIVLPRSFGPAIVGSREHWQKVQIAGVEDEVGAHCGLFIKNQNLEYEAFVERVAGLVSAWCSDL